MNYIQRIYDLLTEAQINEAKKAPLPKNVAKREGAKPKAMITPGMAKHARKGPKSAAQVAKQRARKGAEPVIHPAVAAGSSQERAGKPGSSPLNKGGKPSDRISSRRSY